MAFKIPEIEIQITERCREKFLGETEFHCRGEEARITYPNEGLDYVRNQVYLMGMQSDLSIDRSNY